MNKNKLKKKFNPNLLWYYALGAIAVWTLFIILSLLWHRKTIRSSTLEAARIEARDVLQNHVIYRSWNASHGGLYAPVTPKTRPNPYLDIPERDIQTPSGVKLTKINPAYMTRQVIELALKKFGYIGHITSLKPIRPGNKPDDWEAHALKSFERGNNEVSSLAIINKKKYMRLIRPLITEKKCLKCHAKQGYKEGDIRGGISVAVPVAPHFAIEKANLKTFRLMYALLWFAGLAGTVFFIAVLNRQIQKRLIAEDELRRREKMEGVIELAGAICHELNQPLQTILGNSEIIMMDNIDKQSILKRVRLIREQVDRMGKLTGKLIKIASYETKDMPQGKVIDIEKSSR
ncbi:MAG: DUF3365 domain-containing protein [Deltaproteobacteria bacterium]|nr:DUF3365 domain-containing protein [Deltaproteobacteria bacterium]